MGKSLYNEIEMQENRKERGGRLKEKFFRKCLVITARNGILGKEQTRIS